MPSLQEIKNQLNYFPKLNYLFYGKEIKRLPYILLSDEIIHAISSGNYNKYPGILIATQYRLFFLSCLENNGLNPLFSHTYDKVTEVISHKNILFAKLEIKVINLSIIKISVRYGYCNKFRDTILNLKGSYCPSNREFPQNTLPVQQKPCTQNFKPNSDAISITKLLLDEKNHNSEYRRDYFEGYYYFFKDYFEEKYEKKLDSFQDKIDDLIFNPYNYKEHPDKTLKVFDKAQNYAETKILPFFETMKLYYGDEIISRYQEYIDDITNAKKEYLTTDYNIQLKEYKEYLAENEVDR